MTASAADFRPLDLTPDPARAAALDARMRTRLADSLRYIRDQAKGQLDFPDPGFDRLLARLGKGPVSSSVFAIYYDLVLAISQDALDEAQRCIGEIVGLAGDAPYGPLIVPLKDYRTDRTSDRFRRFVDTDPETHFEILPPTPEKVEACRQRIEAAFALLDRASPALSSEIRALLREIVLAVGPEDPDAMLFDGASSFMLWGALVLNADSYQNDIDMVQVLAHESGHNLLFGLCADGPMIENDDSERYASPVRRDPRPMDGIVHAAFVIARMHQAVCALLDADAVEPASRTEAETALVNLQRSFAHAMNTVDQHARLTPLGKSVMEGARAYMTAHA